MNSIGKILVFIILMISDLQGHGFGKDTIILSCQNDRFCLEHMFTKEYRPHHVVTFDCKKREHPHKKIAAIQPGTTNCYIRISVNDEPSHNIICTPSQEFYLPDQDTWAEACTLKVGDHLLGKCFEHIPITAITFHAEPLDIYLVEVEEPHTFFVGVSSVLTKNMILPCISVGYVFPLGCGTGSGLLGTILSGTVTGSIGYIIGGVAIGYVIKRCMTDPDPHHDFTFDITNIGNLFQFQNKDKPEDNGSVEMPTETTEQSKSEESSPEASHPKTKEDLLKDTIPGRETKGPTDQFEKPGTYQVEDELKSLQPPEIKVTINSKGDQVMIGVWPDGRKVIARNDSTFKTPTLEFQEPGQKRVTKIRYTS